jgi:hypothetical protein
MRSTVRRVSIVIPGLFAVGPLEDTLLSVLERRPRDCELLVVLNQDYADPYGLEGEVQFLRVRRGAGWAECANAGLAACRGPIVHLLAAGCQVADGWCDVALTHFADPRVASVAPLVRTLGGEPGTVGVGYLPGGARRLIPADAPEGVVGPSRVAGFFRREVVVAAGGWSTAVGDAYADVDLGLTLAACGLLAAVEPRAQLTHSSSLPESAFRQGLGAERTFWRSAAGQGWLRELAWHPWVVAIDALSALPRLRILPKLAGRLLGMCDLGRARRHHLRVDQLAQALAVAAVVPWARPARDAMHGPGQRAKAG